MRIGKVSVITGAYNCEAYIEAAYNSLRDQTFGNWEWFVVDDASTDNTLRILKRIASVDQKVRILCNQDNSDVLLLPLQSSSLQL